MMKGDMTRLVKENVQFKTLVDLTLDGFIHVATEGEYYILVNEQGILRYYHPGEDRIQPFIEREEKYDQKPLNL